MVIPESDKRGYYLVGYKKFYNKTEALIHVTEKPYFKIRWIFNDQVYSSIDWTVPIETSLKELYKKRAQQLRDKYDYIVLHYSGGQDSNNMLHSFIDNNIKLDKIIIQVPEPERKHSLKNDNDWKNYWAEIDYQAIPYLKNLGSKLDNIEISIQDMSSSPIELLSNSYWTEKFIPNASYNLGVIARATGQYTSKDILNLVDKDKSSCQLLGIDKPLVHFDGFDYYCFFSDQNAYHVQPIDNTLNDIFKKTVTEFFYWTPDMPEIVVKQAQEIKKTCESNILIKQLFKNTTKKEVGIFRQVMQSIIYDVNHTPLFQTNKPIPDYGQVLNKWFFQGENQLVVQNYENGLNYFKTKIASNYYIDNDINKGYQSVPSMFYKL